MQSQCHHYLKGVFSFKLVSMRPLQTCLIGALYIYQMTRQCALAMNTFKAVETTLLWRESGLPHHSCGPSRTAKFGQNRLVVAGVEGRHLNRLTCPKTEWTHDAGAGPLVKVYPSFVTGTTDDCPITDKSSTPPLLFYRVPRQISPQCVHEFLSGHPAIFARLS